MPEFIQEFAADFDAVTAGLMPEYDGPPYAFVRFGDGEHAILTGGKHEAKSDGWSWPESAERDSIIHLAARSLEFHLGESLSFDAMGWHVGISCRDHHATCHNYFTGHCPVATSQQTFASVFCFSNYRRFKELTKTHCRFLRCRELPNSPLDLRNWTYAIDRLIVDLLVHPPEGPILVSGGPWAKVLIHRYWQVSGRQRDLRRTIIDVGSALDESTHRRRTRRYHNPNHPKADWVPKW